MIIYVIRDGKEFYLLNISLFNMKFTENIKKAKQIKKNDDAKTLICQVYAALYKLNINYDDLGIIYPDMTRKQFIDFML